jgi:hypothetical protein
MSFVAAVEASEVGVVDLFRALETVCRDGNVSDAVFRVVFAVAVRMNRRTGRCDPSVERIAADTGRDRRSVFRALKAAVEAGYLQRRRHAGRRHTNAYSVDWARVVAAGECQRSAAEAERERDAVAVEVAGDVKAAAPAIAEARQRPTLARLVSPTRETQKVALRASEAVAEGAAQKRLYADLRSRGCFEGYLALAMDAPDVEARAILAERSKRGSGLAAALDALGGLVRSRGADGDRFVTVNGDRFVTQT